jgi:hypothetical protein
MRIGLLVGREETFPKAFLERIATLGRADVTAEMCVLGGTRLGGEIPWDVIVDRISHEIPYYRVFLKEAALAGVRVINNPLRVAADDKYFGYALASQDGVAVPKTVLFPNKGYRVGLVPETFRNLAYPIDWRAHAEYVGFPAWLKPTNGRGGHNVHRVENLEQMMAAYDQSGGATMMLQGSRASTIPRGGRLSRARARGSRHASRLHDLGGDRLRHEHRRIRDQGRGALCDRLHEPMSRHGVFVAFGRLLRPRDRRDGAARGARG